MFNIKRLVASFSILFFAVSISAAEQDISHSDFEPERLVKEASEFFGVASEELAKVIAKAVAEHGRPNAYIKGNETSGALGVGLRIGDGELTTVKGVKRKVHWEGPSIGLDIGLNASKVLMLVYDLKRPDDIFQKFSGVEGSLFVVAGAGLNYLQAGDLVLAPIRVGVGWRQGANVGYIKITPPEKDGSI
ncbi:MAG: DUF1134 domain-containing protein [Gammaproteobacteria bacterium]|nr:DUF1134 domain-containing protein [Gammaproteobacteria bacterium]